MSSRREPKGQSLRIEDWTSGWRRHWGTELLCSGPVQWAILLAVGAFGFFYNLHLALFEGSEGLYAQIAREMVQAKEYVRLTYMGEDYINKPPFFFWLLAAATTVFGEHELALRLPGALFSLGTMALAYGLGVMLFSRTVGFWAALVVATTHVFVWYGRRVLFDATLAFFITLALFAWIRAYLQRGPGWWYAASFLAMALGAMTKGLHALALPLVTIAVFSAVRRDLSYLANPFFLAGPPLFLLLVDAYASVLGQGQQWHYHFSSRLRYALDAGGSGAGGGGHPVYWYLSVMWFDLFPWCALVPPALVMLWRRPLREHPSELFALAWALGMFGALSVGQPKREPYLLPVVPAVGLMIGYLYHRVLAEAEARPAGSLLKVMMLGTALAFVAALLVGPSLLERRWDAELDPFPLPYILLILVLSGTLAHLALRSSAAKALVAFGGLAVAFLVGVVGFVLPAIDGATSARGISEEIKRLARESERPVRLYSSGWPKNEDLEYYLRTAPAVPQVESEEGLRDLVHRAGPVIVVTEQQRYAKLRQREDLAVSLLREFPQPRAKSFFLLSIGPRGAGSMADSVPPGRDEARGPLL